MLRKLEYVRCMCVLLTYSLLNTCLIRLPERLGALYDIYIYIYIGRSARSTEHHFLFQKSSSWEKHFGLSINIVTQDEYCSCVRGWKMARPGRLAVGCRVEIGHSLVHHSCRRGSCPFRAWGSVPSKCIKFLDQHFNFLTPDLEGVGKNNGRCP